MAIRPDIDMAAPGSGLAEGQDAYAYALAEEMQRRRAEQRQDAQLAASRQGSMYAGKFAGGGGGGGGNGGFATQGDGQGRPVGLAAFRAPRVQRDPLQVMGRQLAIMKMEDEGDGAFRYDPKTQRVIVDPKKGEERRERLKRQRELERRIKAMEESAKIGKTLAESEKIMREAQNLEATGDFDLATQGYRFANTLADSASERASKAAGDKRADKELEFKLSEERKKLEQELVTAQGAKLKAEINTKIEELRRAEDQAKAATKAGAEAGKGPSSTRISTLKAITVDRADQIHREVAKLREDREAALEMEDTAKAARLTADITTMEAEARGLEDTFRTAVTEMDPEIAKVLLVDDLKRQRAAEDAEREERKAEEETVRSLKDKPAPVALQAMETMFAGDGLPPVAAMKALMLKSISEGEPFDPIQEALVFSAKFPQLEHIAIDYFERLHELYKTQWFREPEFQMAIRNLPNPMGGRFSTGRQRAFRGRANETPVTPGAGGGLGGNIPGPGDLFRRGMNPNEF